MHRGCREQEVLGGDVLVAERRHLLLGEVHHLEAGAREARLRDGLTADCGESADHGVDGGENGLAVGTDLGQQVRGEGIRLLEQRRDEVGRFDLVVVARDDVIDRRLQRLS